MVTVDSPSEPTTEAAVDVRARWRSLAASPAALAMALAGVAFAVRAVGLTRSFELWVDEMLYADLGASVSRGELPSLPDGPFFLHPPGFFLLEGGIIRLFGLSTRHSMSLVYNLRWLTAVLGALTVGVAFLLLRRVAGTWPATWGALALVFEPFVLRINSRVFLETLAGLAVVAGLLVLVRHLQRPGEGRPGVRLLVAGLFLGYAVFTKDTFAFYAVVPVLLAVAWRRTLEVREATVVLVGAVLPYAVYLAFLAADGYLGPWATATRLGVLRLVGAVRTTGFTAPGAPSLVDRLVEQAQHYGTSYVLLLLCPLAGLVASFSSRRERRLIGLTGVVMGGYGGYLVMFGTVEEQYAYPIMVAGITALTVCAGMALERGRRPRRLTIPLLLAFLAAGMSLGLLQELTTDDGFRSFRTWAADNLPAGARVGVTNDTAVRAFSDDSRFGPWPTAALLEKNGAQYVLTVSLPTREGYALARPQLLDWLEANARAVFRDSGPTNGETVLWFISRDQLAGAAARGVGGPAPAALDAGTGGANSTRGVGSGTP